MTSLCVVGTALILLMSSGSLGTDENKNEFAEMCKIYTLLTTKPKGIEIHEGEKNVDPSAAAQAIVGEIELYSLATTDEGLYNLIKDRENKDGIPESTPGVSEISATKWAKWHKLLVDAPTEPTKNTRGSPKSPPGEKRQRSRANRLINKVLERAQATSQKINKLEEEVKNNLADAQKHMVSAVYGTAAVEAAWKPGKNETFDWKNYEVDANSFSSDGYNAGCKNAGADAGKSMVNDFCCIYALASGASANVVGATAGSISGNAYGSGLPANQARWTAVKTGCGALTVTKGRIEPTATNLLSAIAIHRGLLGKNWVVHSGVSTDQANAANKDFILGRFVYSAAGTIECDGVNPTGRQSRGICVSYASTLGAGKEIPWVEQIQTAANLLEKAERQKQHLKAMLITLEKDEHQPELIYEGTLVGEAEGNKLNTKADPKSEPNGQSTAASGPSKAIDRSRYSRQATKVLAFLRFLALP